jgi:hypothetical protein
MLSRSRTRPCSRRAPLALHHLTWVVRSDTQGSSIGHSNFTRRRADSAIMFVNLNLQLVGD